MKKIIAITSCLLAISGATHAGWLDAVKGVADTAKGGSSLTSAIPGTDSKSMVTAAIKTSLGDKTDKASIKAKFGEPTVAPFKNAAGDEIWQYGMAGMLKSLGSAAAMLNTVVKDMTQTVEFTFKADVMSNLAVVDATNAQKPAVPAEGEAAATPAAETPAAETAPATEAPATDAATPASTETTPATALPAEAAAATAAAAAAPTAAKALKESKKKKKKKKKSDDKKD